MVDLFLSVGRLLVALFLVFLNGFFVAAEFAYVRIRPTTVERLVETGSPGAESLQTAVGALDDYLAVTQLGITIASLGLGWAGEPAHRREPVGGHVGPHELQQCTGLLTGCLSLAKAGNKLQRRHVDAVVGRAGEFVEAVLPRVPAEVFEAFVALLRHVGPVQAFSQPDEVPRVHESDVRISGSDPVTQASLHRVFHQFPQPLAHLFVKLFPVPQPEHRGRLYREFHRVPILHLRPVRIPEEIAVSRFIRVALLHALSQFENPVQPVQVSVRLAQCEGVPEKLPRRIRSIHRVLLDALPEVLVRVNNPVRHLLE